MWVFGMMPQVAGGEADCVEMLRRLATEMGVAVGKDMRAMMQHDGADTPGGVGGYDSHSVPGFRQWRGCEPARRWRRLRHPR